MPVAESAETEPQFEIIEEDIKEVNADEVRIPVECARRSAFKDLSARKMVCRYAKRNLGMSSPAIEPGAGGGVQSSGDKYRNVYVVTDM